MNIFVTSTQPEEAATHLDDKRLKHMPKETIEMLACYIHSVTGKWIVDFPFWDRSKQGVDIVDKWYLYNHPCNSWVRADRANATWTLKYLCAMLDEYLYRFEESSEYEVIYRTIRDQVYVVDRQPKRFRNSSLFKGTDVIDAYRMTMINKWEYTDKVKPPVFTKRGKPSWYEEYKEILIKN